MLCKNCRVNELKSRREITLDACWRCLKQVDDYIRERFDCEPDYSRAYVVDGMKYIPMKEVRNE